MHDPAELDALAEDYLRATDPIRQSGFHGGPERWRREREPILDAVEGDGSLLDVGCANGYLLECLVAWGRERGLTLAPFGVERHAGLAALATERLGAAAVECADATSLRPARRFDTVYALADCVAPEKTTRWIQDLCTYFVAPGGRLVLGAYADRGGRPADDPGRRLEEAGRLVECANDVEEGRSRFAWCRV